MTVREWSTGTRPAALVPAPERCPSVRWKNSALFSQLLYGNTTRMGSTHAWRWRGSLVRSEDTTMLKCTPSQRRTRTQRMTFSNIDERPLGGIYVCHLVASGTPVREPITYGRGHEVAKTHRLSHPARRKEKRDQMAIARVRFSVVCDGCVPQQGNKQSFLPNVTLPQANIMTNLPLSTVPSSSTGTAKSQGRKRFNSLPPSVVETLKRWLLTHMNHPYPSDQEKLDLCEQTGIDLKRLNNWFVNNRIRYWKPRMEALQQHKQKPGSKSKGCENIEATPTIASSPSLSVPVLPTLVLAATLFNPPPLPPPSSTRMTRIISSQSSTPPSKKPRPNAVSPSSSRDGCGSTSTSTRTTSTATKSRRLSTCSPSVVSEGSLSSVEEYDEDKEDWSDQNDGDEGCGGSRTIPPSPPSTSSSLDRSQNDDNTTKKRAHCELDVDSSQSSEQLSFARSKYSRHDEGLWRESCVTSPQIYHETLPSLDEATVLFGFATQSPTLSLQESGL
jgi:Homeobox KN domain